MKKSKFLLLGLVLILMSSFTYASEGTYTGKSFSTLECGANFAGIHINDDATKMWTLSLLASPRVCLWSLDEDGVGTYINSTIPSAAGAWGGQGLSGNATHHFYYDDAAPKSVEVYDNSWTYIAGSSFAITGVYYRGLGANTTNIFGMDNRDEKIYKYSAGGTVVGNIDISQFVHETQSGVDKLGDYFWFTENNGNTVQKILDNGTIVHSWPYGSQFTGHSRIAVRGDWIWLAEYINERVWIYDGNVTAVDSTPPTITDAICTSCYSGTNNTIDTTPTINVTLSDTGDACISNSSIGNYTDCISRGGLCSVAEVNTKGVCTLQESEKLTNYYTPQPLYFFANSSDGVYSLNYNNTIGVTLLGMLSGNVTDSDNNLIEGALVTASLNNTPTVLYNTTSDNIGEWTMNPSIAGIYTVCAYKPKNKTLRGDCTPFVMVP